MPQHSLVENDWVVLPGRTVFLTFSWFNRYEDTPPPLRLALSLSLSINLALTRV